MDIKYGINDAFTLDAILIPDFGQTKFDDQILNLGPFEQQFNENRSFLLKVPTYSVKGDLLYSRRIGGRPNNQQQLQKRDHYRKSFQRRSNQCIKSIWKNKRWLGIGILNAVTKGHLQQLKTKTLRNKKRRG
jgi:hypothetical protein